MMEIEIKSDQASPVITVRELAGYLKVHQSTIYRLLRGHKLPSFRVGSDWRFSREAVDQWMSEQQKRI
jgi:excisionase family DNA binding protein